MLYTLFSVSCNYSLKKSQLETKRLGNKRKSLAVTAIRINKAIAVLDNFGDISGLKLNPSKTKALWLGSWRHKQDKPFGLHWPDKPIRVLGTFISYNEKENEKYNFTLKLQKLKTILDIWSCRSHTLFGRCLITKSLGIS